jgi:hypothetical protein
LENATLLLNLFHFILKNNFELGIKDPAFMQLNERLYSFYFGTVYVRALLKSKTTSQKGNENRRLCGSENVRSSTIPIGIESKIKPPSVSMEPGKFQMV